MSEREADVLAALALGPCDSIKELAARIGLGARYTTEIVGNLHRRGEIQCDRWGTAYIAVWIPEAASGVRLM
jgi:DNA-binding MarR family transcriptional regulator